MDSDIYNGKLALSAQIPDLYSKYVWFEPRTGRRHADWEVSLKASRPISIWYLKLGKDHFLRHLPYSLIIIRLFYTTDIVTASLT
jgi:hypothetical protein